MAAQFCCSLRTRGARAGSSIGSIAAVPCTTFGFGLFTERVDLGPRAPRSQPRRVLPYYGGGQVLLPPLNGKVSHGLTARNSHSSGRLCIVRQRLFRVLARGVNRAQGVTLSSLPLASSVSR